MTKMPRLPFCWLMALGVGTALFGVFPDRLDTAATDALLLGCMDYRLTEGTECYVAGRSLGGKYDHVILAGASLGAITEKFPDRGKTFFEHLDVAIQLHQIHQVSGLDHRDCGASKTILEQDLPANRARGNGLQPRSSEHCQPRSRSGTRNSMSNSC